MFESVVDDVENRLNVRYTYMAEEMYSILEFNLLST